MLYCDAATFCRRSNDAGIMTDETGRRCAQESIDIIIMKNKYYYLFIKNNFDYLLILMLCYLVKGQPKTNNPQPKTDNQINTIIMLIRPDKRFGIKGNHFHLYYLVESFSFINFVPDKL